MMVEWGMELNVLVILNDIVNSLFFFFMVFLIWFLRWVRVFIVDCWV